MVSYSALRADLWLLPISGLMEFICKKYKLLDI